MDRQLRGKARAWLAAAGLWLAALAPACGSDTDSFDVTLSTATATVDLGSATGQVPDIACDPAAPQQCGADADIAISGDAGTAAIRAGCDPATNHCFVTSQVRIARTVTVLDDDSVGSWIGRHSLTFVRSVDVGVTVPTNTLTFDVPGIDVFVGPEGTALETDPGVLAVGSVALVPAGTVVAEPRQVALADGSPARDFVEATVLDRKPFVFVMVFSPRLESGAAVPAGVLEVALLPRVRIGLPF